MKMMKLLQEIIISKCRLKKKRNLPRMNFFTRFFSILFFPHGSYDELNIWASDKCTPLVREITFENAEELTEEGLPFLILFHAPDDNESIKRYTDIVQRELLDDKRKKHFLIRNISFYVDNILTIKFDSNLLI